MTAILSPCGQYRYVLTRPKLPGTFPDRGTALFCMLNPSTADASLDDPTIRRCRGFADAWGCNGMTVVNLYALRSTDPKALWAHQAPVGEENDFYLKAAAHKHGGVVCAWGANAKPERVAQVLRIFRDAGLAERDILCLGTTKAGAPKHPLYLRGDTMYDAWPGARTDSEVSAHG